MLSLSLSAIRNLLDINTKNLNYMKPVKLKDGCTSAYSSAEIVPELTLSILNRKLFQMFSDFFAKSQSMIIIFFHYSIVLLYLVLTWNFLDLLFYLIDIYVKDFKI